jgi:hypothetical protein
MHVLTHTYTHARLHTHTHACTHTRAHAHMSYTDTCPTQTHALLAAFQHFSDASTWTAEWDAPSRHSQLEERYGKNPHCTVNKSGCFLCLPRWGLENQSRSAPSPSAFLCADRPWRDAPSHTPAPPNRLLFPSHPPPQCHLY